ncbi:MAG: NrfD/PsrC family molybdoenzyme membrane anchor subunit [Planctomycetota bacterium]|jgi:formate-dependent nitrite reductase membrane component NrfD
MSEQGAVVHLAYDWMIVTYFFFGGLSAGAYMFSVAANYWKKEFKPLAKTAAILAPITLAIGMFFLLVDLGKPFRMWRLFVSFNPSSAISWGTWFLCIFFLLSLVYTRLLTKGEDEKAKKYAYLGLPLGFLVAVYTAIILAQSPGTALWRHVIAILPWLFLLGGLISGIALVIVVSAGRSDSVLLAKLGKFVAWLVLLELGIIFTDVVILLNGDIIAVESAKSFLVGKFSFLFWVLEIILGSLIPVIILLRTKVSAKGLAVASILILTGIYVMRYIVVIGGQLTG